jgi:hypothetical protein
MRRLLVVLTALAVALVSVGCSDDDADVDTGDRPTDDGGTTDDGGDPVDDPADDPAPPGAVIAIRSGGGFVPFGTDFAYVPTVILADGTAFTGGAVPAIFPGPALNPVSTGTVPVDELAELLERADEAGLLDGAIDFGQPGVTDLPTTSITLVVDGQTYSHDIYALGVEQGGLGDEVGLSADQIDLRRFAASFLEEVSALVSSEADQIYEPEAYQVLSLEVDPSQVGADVPPNELDWPFADIALGQAECADVEGDDAATFRELLTQATQITIWRDAAGGTYQLTVRARLPFDDTCP